MNRNNSIQKKKKHPKEKKIIAHYEQAIFFINKSIKVVRKIKKKKQSLARTNKLAHYHSFN